MDRWLTEFVKLWVVIDPIGTQPVFVILLGLLFCASRIIAVIGNAGASVISRVMGLILASVGVDGIIKAVRVVVAG